MTADTALQFIAKDERFLLEILFQMDDRKIRHREGVEEVVERYLVSQLADENGYLKPNALTEEQINKLQQDLLEMYSPERLDDAIAESIALVDSRLITIDTLMRDLELDEGILGASVFEMETVQDQIDNISRGFMRGAEGEGDYEGSIKRISDSMNRYRFDRSKSEYTLRSEFMETLQQDANVGANHANSVAVSSMATIDRELKRVQAADAGMRHGLYSGIHDDLIRPFCDKWLGQVKEYDFWDNLSNDMPAGLLDFPASVYCGGINCRHRIIPWDLDWSNGDADLRERFAMHLNREIDASQYPLRRWIIAA